MHVFVTGASGHIASAVIPELLSAGHEVTGLARSNRSADAVRTLGAQAYRGDLDDLDRLTAAARTADGVIHLAFPNQEMRGGDLAGAAATDLRAIQVMGNALHGTGNPSSAPAPPSGWSWPESEAHSPSTTRYPAAPASTPKTT